MHDKEYSTRFIRFGGGVLVHADVREGSLAMPVSNMHAVVFSIVRNVVLLVASEERVIGSKKKHGITFQDLAYDWPVTAI